MQLREQIETISNRQSSDFTSDDRAVFEEFKRALNRGEVRAAEKSATGTWQVNAWVKQGILLGFRMGKLIDQSAASGLKFFDKIHTPFDQLRFKRTFESFPVARVFATASTLRRVLFACRRCTSMQARTLMKVR